MLKVTLARLRPLLFDGDGTGKDTIKVETIHKLASTARTNSVKYARTPPQFTLVGGRAQHTNNHDHKD